MDWDHDGLRRKRNLPTPSMTLQKLVIQQDNSRKGLYSVTNLFNSIVQIDGIIQFPSIEWDESTDEGDQIKESFSYLESVPALTDSTLESQQNRQGSISLIRSKKSTSLSSLVADAHSPTSMFSNRVNQLFVFDVCQKKYKKNRRRVRSSKTSNSEHLHRINSSMDKQQPHA